MDLYKGRRRGDVVGWRRERWRLIQIRVRAERRQRRERWRLIQIRVRAERRQRELQVYMKERERNSFYINEELNGN
ncbi:hypothetical protein HanRHA438_Chr17g0841761 [Helianthus annuus]|nr:hypothetical protein HanRHA438_Chr17g0841761 [Helianthus annuus]